MISLKIFLVIFYSKGEVHLIRLSKSLVWSLYRKLPARQAKTTTTGAMNCHLCFNFFKDSIKGRLKKKKTQESFNLFLCWGFTKLQIKENSIVRIFQRFQRGLYVVDVRSCFDWSLWTNFLQKNSAENSEIFS